MIKVLPLILAAAVFAGCATTRPMGKVEVGYTTDQVQVALGKPDRVYKRQTATGDLEAWGYMPYWPGFGLPPQPIGTRGSLSTDIPLESIRDDEDVRVFFKGGKVVAVESRQSK